MVPVIHQHILLGTTGGEGCKPSVGFFTPADFLAFSDSMEGVRSGRFRKRGKYAALQAHRPIEHVHFILCQVLSQY